MINAAEAFRLAGTPTACRRYGNGHINETYLLTTDQPHDYILQKINRAVFPDVEKLMGNVVAVTDHLRAACPDPRRGITLVPTRTGGAFYRDEGGEYWRVVEFIDRSVCLEKAETPADMRENGVALGQFQRQLADFPACSLAEILPRFHDTPYRFQQLRQAVEADPVGRVRLALPELEAFLRREKEADELMNMQRTGLLPTRVTHNDTKLNNVMLDADTHRALCLIDLDTVMPGLVAYDFGDAIRFGANTAAEDERRLNLVHLDMALYRAFTEGFLEACGEYLTENEIASLPVGARLMTMECGVRFLTDFLGGDAYFRVERPDHNLDRARCQLRLLEDMEQRRADMERAVEQYGRKKL